MDTLEALHKRTSCPRLIEPGPSAEQLENICKAALRAPDHALLTPWRFLLVRDESRNKLGELFVDAAKQNTPVPSEAKLASIALKPLRAPLVIVCIAAIKDHPKVPPIEQELSAAAATQNMLLAAFAQNLGAMWRTGSMAYNPIVKKGLGLKDNEKICGFLYLGTPAAPPRKVTELVSTEFFQDW